MRKLKTLPAGNIGLKAAVPKPQLRHVRSFPNLIFVLSTNAPSQLPTAEGTMGAFNKPADASFSNEIFISNHE